MWKKKKYNRRKISLYQKALSRESEKAIQIRRCEKQT